MSKRGKILRDTNAGTGLVVVEELRRSVSRTTHLLIGAQEQRSLNYD